MPSSELKYCHFIPGLDFRLSANTGKGREGQRLYCKCLLNNRQNLGHGYAGYSVIHMSLRIKRMDCELLGSLQYILSFGYRILTCVLAVTTGRTEITPFALTSAEYLLNAVFLLGQRVNSIFTEIPSQSRQLCFRSLQHKTAFHKELEGGDANRNLLTKTGRGETERSHWCRLH